MVSEEDEKRWRKALEAMGTWNVKILLGPLDPLHPEQSVPSVGEREPWPTLEFVRDWLREKEAAAQRRETRHFWWVLGVGIVAAVAAIIAASPEIKNVFRLFP
jgi:hypothetical protein